MCWPLRVENVDSVRRWHLPPIFDVSGEHRARSSPPRCGTRWDIGPYRTSNHQPALPPSLGTTPHPFHLHIAHSTSRSPAPIQDAAAAPPRSEHRTRGATPATRRYEHCPPGALIHVDIKKFGRIPDAVGIATSVARSAIDTTRNMSAGTRTPTTPSTITAHWGTRQILGDERKEISSGFSERAKSLLRDP